MGGRKNRVCCEGGKYVMCLDERFVYAFLITCT